MRVALLTIVDSLPAIDLSGPQRAIARATTAGHKVLVHGVVKNEENGIRAELAKWNQMEDVDAMIVTRTVDRGHAIAALKPLLTKMRPGIDDIVSRLGDKGVATSTIASPNGKHGTKLVFVLPAGTAGAHATDLLVTTLSEIEAAEDGVPRALPIEKTASGAGSAVLRVPALSPAKLGRAYVVPRIPPPLDPDTRPIDVANLEKQLELSNANDAPTREWDLGRLSRLPPGADQDLVDATMEDAAGPVTMVTELPAPAPLLPPARPAPLPVKKPLRPETPVEDKATLPFQRAEVTPVPAVLPSKPIATKKQAVVTGSARTAAATAMPSTAMRAPAAPAPVAPAPAPTPARPKSKTKELDSGWGDDDPIAAPPPKVAEASPKRPKTEPPPTRRSKTEPPPPPAARAAAAPAHAAPNPKFIESKTEELSSDALETLEEISPITSQEIRLATIDAELEPEPPAVAKPEPAKREPPKPTPPPPQPAPKPAPMHLDETPIPKANSTQAAAAAPVAMFDERPRSSSKGKKGKTGKTGKWILLALVPIVGFGAGIAALEYLAKDDVTKPVAVATAPSDAAALEPTERADAAVAAVDAGVAVATAPIDAGPGGARTNTGGARTNTGGTRTNTGGTRTNTGTTGGSAIAGGGSDQSPPPTTPTPIDPKTDPKTPPPASDDCGEAECTMHNYDKPCCEKWKPKVPQFQPRPSGTPEALDQTMVKEGVARVKPLVIACGEKHPAKGTVRVAVVVGPDGKVTDASVVESPDPTLGTCVAGALKKAKFVVTETGGSFKYPFVF